MFTLDYFGPGTFPENEAEAAEPLKSNEAFAKIFHRPHIVFSALKKERKWVHAAILMTLLLGIHSLATAFGTSTQVRTSQSSDVESIVAAIQQDLRGSSENQTNVESTANELPPKRDRIPLDFGRLWSGDFVIAMFITTALLPVAFAGIVIYAFLDAVYFRIVSALLKIEFKLEDWIALSIWSRVPGIVLSVVVVILGVITLGRQPDSEAFALLALKRWVELPEFHSGNFGIEFKNLDVALAWTIVLQTIGFRDWSGKSSTVSFAIVAAPTLFGVMIALAYIWLA